MNDIARFDRREMVALAARGLGKVDAMGPRGVTLVTMLEIEAMAMLLAIQGLRPIYPDSYHIKEKTND